MFTIVSIHTSSDAEIEDTNGDGDLRTGQLDNPEPSRSQAATAQPRCPLPSPKFVERSGELSRLKEFFARSDLDWKRFVLIGMGGCGKSQIASQYTHGHVFKENMYKPSMVFFVDATTATTLEESYAAIARCKGVGTSSKDALLWLSSVQEPSFILIDNVDSLSLDLKEYMPRSTRAHILITTRLQNEGRLYASADDSYIDLDALPARDAEELLVRTAMLASDSLKDVAVLVQELCCYALAIAQAGACIAHLHLAVNRYLERYRRLGTSLMDGKNDGVGPRALYGYSKVVRYSWTLSYDELPTASKDLFNLCAFLHHTGISQGLFERATNALKNYKPTVPFSPDEEAAWAIVTSVLESFQADDRSFDEFAFQQCISPILSLSLMRLDPATRIHSIHPLILDSLRRFASSHLPTSLLLTLAISFAEDDTLFLVPLVPHVDSVVGRSDLVQLSSDPSRYHPDIAMAFSFVYTATGRYQLAEHLQRATVARRTMDLGSGDETTLRASSSLCTTLRGMGQLATAEAMGRSLRADWIRAYGENHSGTLEASLELAETLGKLWHYHEVETLELEVLSRRRQLLGEDHSETIAAMGALAGTFDNTGRYQEAETMWREVLSRRRHLLGENHPDTALTMSYQAITLGRLGRYQEAETIEREVLSRRRRILGEDHPDAIKAMANLAITFRYSGRNQEAETMEREVLFRRRSLLGEDHPDTTEAMSSLAAMLRSFGRYPEAETMEVDVLSRRRRLLGEDHPYTLAAMANLAATLRGFGRYSEAETMEVDVLSRRRPLLSEDHPYTITAMANLATTLHSLGRYPEAEALKAEVLSRRRLLLGEDHPDTAQAMSNLAATLYELGRHHEGETMEREVLSRRRRLLGENHPDTITAMGNLADMLYNLGRYSEAETLDLEVLSRRRSLLGEDHPDTTEVMSGLAATLSNLERWDEAEKLHQEVLVRRRRILGEDHPSTVLSKEWLAWITSHRNPEASQEAVEEQNGLLRESSAASAPLGHVSPAELEDASPDIQVTEDASPVPIPDSDATVPKRRKWMKKLKDRFRRSK